MLLRDLTTAYSEILDREVAKIVDSHQHWRDEPYYIFIDLRSDYKGPRIDDSPTKTRIIRVNEQRTLHNKITVCQTLKILMALTGGFRQLGTCCLEIDNKQGRYEWKWILPADRPITQPGVEFDGASEFVGKSVKGIPL